MTTTNVGGFTPRGLDYIKAAQALLAKADGRDKLVATLQYAAMFAAAGSPGKALNVQKSLSNARKPFRVLKVTSPAPARAALEVLTPPCLLFRMGPVQRPPVRVCSRWRRSCRCSWRRPGR